VRVRTIPHANLKTSASASLDRLGVQCTRAAFFICDEGVMRACGGYVTFVTIQPASGGSLFELSPENFPVVELKLYGLPVSAKQSKLLSTLVCQTFQKFGSRQGRRRRF